MSHFGDDLPSQSLDWCKTTSLLNYINKTTTENNTKKPKVLNYKKLLTYAQTKSSGKLECSVINIT